MVGVSEVRLVHRGTPARLHARCRYDTRIHESSAIGCSHAAGIEGGDYSDYFVTYYSNANTSGAPDGTLRIVNDGDYATTAPGLWAAIYVFDDSQEMRSCCACYISSDGLLSESVNKELTSNDFTARGELQRGVIKVISSSSSNPASIEKWKMSLVEAANAALNAVQEMILKEENILLPMSLETLSEDEWGEIWSVSPQYGWCIVEPQQGYTPAVVRHPNP